MLESGNGNGPTIGRLNDRAGSSKADERVAETLVADAEQSPKLCAALRRTRVAEGVEDEVVEIVRDVIVGVDGRGDREVNGAVVGGDELEATWMWRRGGAVLDGEQQRVGVATEVQVGVAPGVEIAAASEGEPSLRTNRAGFAGVMDDEDSDVVLALEGAEVAKERGDFAGVVLVDAVEADERIEDE